MKTITFKKIMLPLLGILASCNGQIKNSKTTTVSISGNCEMCEKTIETAGAMSKKSSVDWDKDHKTAKVVFDSTKTSVDEILKKIALSGYDNELYLAPEAAYKALPECCRYTRRNATQTKATTSNQASPQSNAAQGQSIVIDHYIKLKDALVRSDAPSAQKQAAELYQSLGTGQFAEKDISDLKDKAKQIAETASLEKQRTLFAQLSEPMITLVQSIDMDHTLYEQHCPMYNDGKGANWLSYESSIKNPYYGNQMLTCGKVVQKITK